jgi:hypothetical protein
MMSISALRNHLYFAPISRVLLLAVVTVVALFVWEGSKGFTLWDEGFLWYGVQRVMLGDVPIRDFQAYDPGRYYWSASLMQLTGAHGIMALRGTLLILQAITLVGALSLLASIEPRRSDWTILVLCVLVLGAWMVPRYKISDTFSSIALIGALTLLVRQPSRRYHFLAGLTLGLVACIGRNHGAYGIAASIGVYCYLALRCQDWTSWRQGVLLFLAGLALGYLPMLGMLLLVPNFASAFIESIRLLFEVKTTNLPLPVPWPWRVRLTNISVQESVRQVLIGLFFVGTIAFGCWSLFYVLVGKLRGTPRRPLFVACAFTALPYAHYAFSRADPGHLALGIFPMLLGILALALDRSRNARWGLIAVLAATSWFAILDRHPGWQCRTATGCEWISIGSDKVGVDRGTADDVSLLLQLKEKYAPAGQSFFVAPFWPGAYALLGSRSPTWEIYSFWPKSDGFQRNEIARLEMARPAFVVIVNARLDSRDDLRYQFTHPLIEQYVRTNFAPVKGASTNPTLQIYHSPDS